MSRDRNEELGERARPGPPAPDSREEPDEWTRMIAAFRRSAPSGSAPPWLEQRVMTEIEALPERSAVQRALAWLVSPAPIRVSPLTAGLVTAVFALALLWPGRSTGPAAGEGGGQLPTGLVVEQVVYVQFVLEAPTATSVAVAGDFSDWQPSFTLTDADGDGVWTGRVPVRPGLHGYMFLVDDIQWQTDPNAERYQDDGFGNRNAVLAVGASG